MCHNQDFCFNLLLQLFTFVLVHLFGYFAMKSSFLYLIVLGKKF